MKAIKFPFSINSGRAVQTTTSYEEIVRGQVIDALMTNRAERVFRSEYGCDIQSALFDPTDLLARADAANIIKGKLQRLVPRSYISDVSIDSSESETGVLFISIIYRPVSGQTDQVLKVPVSSEFILRSIGSQA